MYSVGFWYHWRLHEVYHAEPAGERVLEQREGVLYVADVAVEVAPARAAPVVYHSQTQNLKLELEVVLGFHYLNLRLICATEYRGAIQ